MSAAAVKLDSKTEVKIKSFLLFVPVSLIHIKYHLQIFLTFPQQYPNNKFFSHITLWILFLPRKYFVL